MDIKINIPNISQCQRPLSHNEETVSLESIQLNPVDEQNKSIKYEETIMPHSYAATQLKKDYDTTLNELHPISKLHNESLVPRSPSSLSRRASICTSHTSKHRSVAPAKIYQQLPRFYFPNGKPPSNEELSYINTTIDECFDRYSIIDINALQELLLSFSLTSYLSSTLFNKFNDSIEKNELKQFFISISNYDMPSKLFKILQHDDRNYLTRKDFFYLMNEIINYHPGLSFLSHSEEYQNMYITAVIERIFYSINKLADGRMTLRELKRSNLHSVIFSLDDDDILHDFFSYEHFYVCYVLFYNLDKNHNNYLTKVDLFHSSFNAINTRAMDRIFNGYARRLKMDNMMNFEDFIPFLISEEDKTSDVGQEYWFNVLDLHTDQVITVDEIQFFYEEQAMRMKKLIGLTDNHFQNFLCLLNDIIQPAEYNFFTMNDIKKSNMSSVFYNLLCNFEKYLHYDSRNIFSIEQKNSNPTMNDFDRYVMNTYSRMCE